MKMHSDDTKITVCCPSGHRLRGEVRLTGSTIRCPRCSVEFVFAAADPEVAAGQPSPRRATVSDTGVLRILGDVPPAPEENADRQPPPSRSTVSDTGVLRILGESPQAPEVSADSEPSEERPCPRCNLAISPNASVCPHCSTYVGVMPSFMQQLGDSWDSKWTG